MCNGPERAVECIHKPVTVFAKILKGGGDNEPCYLGLRRRERTECFNGDFYYSSSVTCFKPPTHALCLKHLNQLIIH